MDIGWDPIGPWNWVSDIGDLRAAPDALIASGPQDIRALTDAMSETIDRMPWDRAARHLDWG
eukprot:1818599-Pyramimonas_sp.AAC.1